MQLPKLTYRGVFIVLHMISQAMAGNAFYDETCNEQDNVCVLMAPGAFGGFIVGMMAISAIIVLLIWGCTRASSGQPFFCCCRTNKDQVINYQNVADTTQNIPRQQTQNFQHLPPQDQTQNYRQTPYQQSYNTQQTQQHAQNYQPTSLQQPMNFHQISQEKALNE